MRIVTVLVMLGLATSPAFTSAAETFLTTEKVQDVDIDVNAIGGKWFAIHKKDRRWLLSRTTVSAVPDSEMGGLFEIRTRHKNVAGLLRPANLTEGPLEPASLITDDLGNSRSFRFKGKKYELVVKPVKFKYYSPELKQTFDNVRNDVYLSDGQTMTLVYGGRKTNESCAGPFVGWAGDIDRDGKPDFIGQFSDDSEKNASTCVFLSSRAKNGRLVANAGCQFFSG